MWHFMKLKENNFLLKQLWGPCKPEGCLEAVSGPQGTGPFWKTSGNCTSNSNTANQVQSCLLRNSPVSGNSVAKKESLLVQTCAVKSVLRCVCVWRGVVLIKNHFNFEWFFTKQHTDSNKGHPSIPLSSSSF